MPRRLVFALLLLVAAPPGAAAQYAARVDVAGTAARIGDLSAAGVMLAPALRLPWWSAEIGGRFHAWTGGAGNRVHGAALEGSLVAPLWSNVGVAVDAAAEDMALPGLEAVRSGELGARVHLARDHGGLWLGVLSAAAWLPPRTGGSTGEAIPGGDSLHQQPGGPGGVPGLRRERWLGGGEAGAWTIARGVTVSASASMTQINGLSWREQRDSTFVAFDSTLGYHERTVAVSRHVTGSAAFAELRAGASVDVVGVSLVATGGLRAGGHGVERDLFGSLAAAYALTPDLALTARLARTPADILRARPAQRIAMLGVSIAPGRVRETVRARLVPTRAFAHAFAIEGGPGDLRTIRIRAAAAQSVEIMGDFTGWRPIALRRERGHWVARLPIPAGVHQLNLRIDGGPWAPPPGVSVVDDGFSGKVGVVVVE